MKIQSVEIGHEQPAAEPAGLGFDRLLLKTALVATMLGSAVLPPMAEAHKNEHCAPDKQIKFQLKDTKYNNLPDVHKYKLIATACAQTKPEILKNVRIVETGGQSEKKVWKFKKFEPGSRHKRFFRLPEQPVKQTIVAKAVDAHGKRLGTGSWYLTPPPPQQRQPQRQPTKKGTATTIDTCSPDPDFKIGIQDDNQFVWQKNIDRNNAFKLAAQTFGATILRMNIIYSQFRAYGPQSYLDTVDAALANGFQVQATIMQTPSFMAGDQALSYSNLDPTVTESFAEEVAKLFGQKVMLYSIYNEPNIDPFSASKSVDDDINGYVAGREGILAANPDAKVLIGELAPTDNEADWLNRFQNVSADGDAIHPYGDQINHLAEMEQAAARPLYLSEYGVPADDPEQWNKDLAAMTTARCAGVKELVFFQLIRRGPNDPPGWDTGVIDQP